MTDKDKKSDADRFLDNLTSFLAEDISPEELVEDLRASGLDPEQLDNEFRALLAEHAPTWRQRAQRERIAALEKFVKRGATPPRARFDIEQDIRGVIQAMRELGAAVPAGAYHQKFLEATDTDLESLLEDLAAQYNVLKSKGNP